MNFDQYLKEARFCSHCGHWKTHSCGILCEFCEQKLSEFFNLKVRQDRYTHHYLIHWDKSVNAEIINNFLYAIKGGVVINTFDWLAQNFILSDEAPSFENPVFIPAPSRSEKQDHASLLAQRLAHYYGGKYVEVFNRTDNSTQKSRDKKSRMKVNFEFKKEIKGEKLEKLLAFKTRVFVDDVLTTGSTAAEGFEHLSKFGNFTCITVAYRPSQGLDERCKTQQVIV